MDSDILFSAAAERNAGPIEQVLARVLPRSGRVLEIASGGGQHAMHFSAAFPGLLWQPSDPDVAARRSVDARVAAAPLNNCAPALELDVLGPWPAITVDAVVAVNMLHVSPWEATLALFDGAAAMLGGEGPLVVYGPFRRGGAHTSEGNREFDQSLRARNPRWGIRDLEAVEAAAEAVGFGRAQVLAMPANNLTLVFRRG